MPFTSILVKVIMAIPLGNYRTYIINVAIMLLWPVLGYMTGNWELAFGFVAQAMSNIFSRDATAKVDSRVIMLEGVLEDLTRQLNANSSNTRDDGK